MRGVAVDSLNKPPSERQLRNAGLDSIRVEMRDSPEFYQYTSKLSLGIEQTWLVGPSTGPIEPILVKANNARQPKLVIIGNEPDLDGPSSWTMTEDEYVALYDKTAASVLNKWPNTKLSLAGMYSAKYAWSVWARVERTPDFLNMHYPNGIDEFKEFSQSQHCIVGEWCWRTATQREMYDWVHHFLDYYAWHWFWFCWGDYMVPTMGLVTQLGYHTKAYHRLKEALLH